MTKKQENTVSMWSVIDEILTNNNAIWVVLIAFKNAVTKFRAAKTAIPVTTSKQKKQNKGIADDKNDFKKIAVEKGAQAAKNLKAYAKDNNNNTLYQEINYSENKLMHLRDEMLPIILNSIHKASTTIPTIADYGNTTATQAALKAAIDTFTAQSPKTREAVVDVSTATANLAQTIKEGNAALVTLDELIGNFQTTAPDFVTTFTKGRIIANLSGGPKKKKAPQNPKEPPPNP
jgi:hypothetical protein